MDFPTRWEHPGSECSIESVLMLGSNVGISLPWRPLQDIEGIQSTESQTIIQLRALICTKYGAKLLATQLSACQTQKPNKGPALGLSAIAGIFRNSETIEAVEDLRERPPAPSWWWGLSNLFETPVFGPVEMIEEDLWQKRNQSNFSSCCSNFHYSRKIAVASWRAWRCDKSKFVIYSRAKVVAISTLSRIEGKANGWNISGYF